MMHGFRHRVPAALTAARNEPKDRCKPKRNTDFRDVLKRGILVVNNLNNKKIKNAKFDRFLMPNKQTFEKETF